MFSNVKYIKSWFKQFKIRLKFDKIKEYKSEHLKENFSLDSMQSKPKMCSS